MTRLPELLVGQVMHRRLRPVEHTFVHPVFYVRLPLDRIDQAAGPLFGIERWRPLSFFRRDHGPRDGRPLRPWIEALLRERGLPHDGEIVLQTFPRVMGWVFNPVSFWFCHDREDRLIAVLAEVNNTFGDTHSYLLHHPEGEPLRDGEELCTAKAFHVSPFCTVQGQYRFRFRHAPDRGIDSACIDHDDASGPLLRTSISGHLQPWSPGAQARVLLRMPLLTLGVWARIHWHAWRLWRKGVPFHGARPPVAPQSAAPAAVTSPCAFADPKDLNT